MESNVDFKKIKAQLPHGAQTEIAKKANVSVNAVHMALSGKSDNLDILNAIADYLELHQNAKSAAMSRISKFIINTKTA